LDTEDADLETIRQARAQLLEAYRPDKLPGPDEALQQQAETRTRQIETAYAQALARRT
jgi:curved DNA-binding protein CbpA